MNLRFLIPILFFVSLLGTAKAQELNIYFKNTGNETVYVAKYYFEWGGILFHSENNGWKPIKVSGWYTLKPGQTSFMGTVYGYSDRMGFAFMKRGGSVVYKSSNASLDRFREQLFIFPKGIFDYVGKAPIGMVKIPTSFEAKLEGYDGEGTLNSYISIPSNTTDTVLPVGDEDASNKPSTSVRPAQPSPQPSPPKKMTLAERIVEARLTKDAPPREITRRFLKAVYAGDFDLAKLYANNSTDDAITELQQVFRSGYRVVNVTIKEEKISGLRASVSWDNGDGAIRTTKLYKNSYGRWEIDDEVNNIK